MKTFAKPTGKSKAMPDMEGLKDLGPSGAFISMMATAIAGLAAAVGIQWRQANKVYGYRLTERDTLNKALTDSTAAINAQTRATEELKEVTDKLADAIERQANAFQRINDRADMRHETLKDEIGRHGTTLSDATRVYMATLVEVRGSIQALAGKHKQ